MSCQPFIYSGCLDCNCTTAWYALSLKSLSSSNLFFDSYIKKMNVTISTIGTAFNTYCSNFLIFELSPTYYSQCLLLKSSPTYRTIFTLGVVCYMPQSLFALKVVS